MKYHLKIDLNISTLVCGLLEYILNIEIMYGQSVKTVEAMFGYVIECFCK